MAHVLLAMSGGVDSSVAAWRLLAEGHQVTGLFMKQGIESLVAPRDSAQQILCTDPAHGADAHRVAQRLGISLIEADVRATFRVVVEYFIDEYLAGKTPNPCVRCNRILKFGALFDEAERIGADLLATGHYARIVPVDDDQFALLRGVDPTKDQSYALFGIERRRLARICFPIGDCRKERIREMAREIGLDVAEKDESQDVCFIPEGDHAAFIRAMRRERQDTAGQIVTVDGHVVGEHGGYERYTVGQRKGLGVAMGDRYFVVRIEPDARHVVIGRREDLARRQFEVERTNWLVDPPTVPFDCDVKIRYRSPAVRGRVVPRGEDTFDVQLEEPRYGVAPGQAAVCYCEDRVLGGGTIR